MANRLELYTMKGSSVTPNTWPGGRGGKPAVVGGLAGAGQRGQGAYAYAPPRSLVAGTESRRTAPEQARSLAPASTAHGKCSRTTCSPAAGRSPRGWSRRQTPRRTAQPPAAPAAAGWPHARRPAGGRGGAGLGTCACLEKHAPHPLAPGNQAPGVLDTPEKALTNVRSGLPAHTLSTPAPGLPAGRHTRRVPGQLPAN